MNEPRQEIETTLGHDLEFSDNYDRESARGANGALYVPTVFVWGGSESFAVERTPAGGLPEIIVGFSGARFCNYDSARTWARRDQRQTLPAATQAA